jgi:hypothetical protein
LWGNYAKAGCRRLIYANTVSVLEPVLIARAVGGRPRITSVLLTANDATAGQRLGGREVGRRLEAHVGRSAKMAVYLEAASLAEVHRIGTDGRAAVDIDLDVIDVERWVDR